jgi:heme oxygenase (biliverdin-producing, ferredoxin)
VRSAAIARIQLTLSGNSTLEHHLAQHVDDPVLTSACNPQIHRASALSSDIARITQLPDWHASPFAQQILNDPPPSVKIYLDRLETVARTEPPLLLAHAYVRYLGDMSGGQFMKRRIKKSLDLEDEALQFFEFESTSSTALPDIKSLKEWFRDGMNNHVVDAHLKGQ